MEIILYTNNNEKNKINKTLIDPTSYEGNLRDITDVINPIILLESATIGEHNYAYIPQFNRYYFITAISSVRTGLWAVALQVDVLMSFKTDILNLVVILNNTESNGINNYLPSDVFRNNVKTRTDIFNFSSGLLDSGEFILITAGG